jgi:NADH dehydrogenase [ubiquinone] 1 alpha subcomplex assembly factor 7
LTYDPSLRRRTPLAVTLADEIARNGPMPVADYVQRCLWDPRAGYYATRNPLGKAGDFITAPEISQIFGELIGLWSAVIWRDLMGAPGAVTLAELGPGRGTLLRDALRATRSLSAYRQALRCHLVEASEPLIELQREALAQPDTSLSWGPDLSGVTAPAIIIANEFFDALPIDQLIMTTDGWRQRAVGVDGQGALCFTTATTAAALPAGFGDAPLGAIAERIRSLEMIDAIAALGPRGPVAALIIDYGHMASATGDTLQAVREHAHEHPLTSPGEADLSVQVDFEALASAAHSAGLDVDGPITQGEFLSRLGIVERARTLMSANPGLAGSIEVAVARLIAPEAMGSRFKVLGLRSSGLPRLPGFGA